MPAYKIGLWLALASPLGGMGPEAPLPVAHLQCGAGCCWAGGVQVDPKGVDGEVLVL